MSSSALLVAGLATVFAAVVLLWVTARLRRDVETIRRQLRRVTVAADEVERVERARRQWIDGVGLARGATGVNRVVRRSGQTIAGIPYAILDGMGLLRGRDE